MRRLWLVALLAACGDNAVRVYISPGGDDGATGGPSSPLRTFAGARDAIRSMRAAGQTGSAEVVVGDGTYEIAAPVRFGPDDSDIHFSAAQGAHPVLSGGQTLEITNDGGIWRAQTNLDFTQLWVGDRRAWRAREPDEGYGAVLGVQEEGLGPIDESGRYTAARQTLQIDPLGAADPATVITVVHRWDVTRKRVETITEAGVITLVGRGMKPWNPLDTDSLYRVENFEAALDTPGEWYLSPSGALTYLPVEGDEATVIAPVTEQLVVITGDEGRPVERVTFDGITFAHTDWRMPEGGFEPAQTAPTVGASIEVDHAREVMFSNCTIAHTGNHALWFRADVQDSGVRDCTLRDLGAGGIRIGDRFVPSETSRITVDNNVITGGGRILPPGVGIWIGQSGDNRLTHNAIRDFFYSGISVGWVWGEGESAATNNEIAFNDISDIGQSLMSDLGGIYTLGPSTGTRIHHNRIHDIRARAYGGWGLYNDEGSSGITMTDNLVYELSGSPYHLHYGHDNVLTNNILAYGRESQVRITKQDRPLALRASRNIVVWAEGRLFEGPMLDAGIAFDHNLYAGPTPDFLGMPFEAWLALGQDAGSVLAASPFVAPSEGNFALRDTSQVARIGFVPFPLDAFGPTVRR